MSSGLVAQLLMAAYEQSKKAHRSGWAELASYWSLCVDSSERRTVVVLDKAKRDSMARHYGGDMSKENYKRFRKGLQAGITALWRPDFMSGVRNGGFEQTLRNVCVPHIEAATGRIAFTEAEQRGDLILRSLNPANGTSTRCEFKTNFASQLGEIRKRSKTAINQAKPSQSSPHEDGVVVYAVAELVRKGGDARSIAARHNECVGPTAYKRFRDDELPPNGMDEVSGVLKSRAFLKRRYEPLFEDGLCELWLQDG